MYIAQRSQMSLRFQFVDTRSTFTENQPYTAESYPVKRKESTMPDHTITDTRGETPYATVKLTPSDLEPKDLAFLREWAGNLDVALEVLLHRILVAAVISQLYAEKIPEI